MLLSATPNTAPSTVLSAVAGGMPRRRLPHVLADVSRDSGSLAFQRRVGVATHAVLAARFRSLRHLPPTQLAAEVSPAAMAAVIACGEQRRRRAAAARVASLVSHYVQCLAPPAFVVFHGAEEAVGDGRVDLAFEHVTLGLFFDELKTWQNGMEQPSLSVSEQLQRYVRGARGLGVPVAGVRLLPLTSMPDARLACLDGREVPLQQTALSPGALARQQQILHTAGGDTAVLPTNVLS
jgi:hypothetical protein